MAAPCICILYRWRLQNGCTDGTPSQKEYLRLTKDPLHLTSPKRFDEVIYTPYAFADGVALDLQSMERIFDESLEATPIANVDDFLEQNIDADGKQIPGSIKYEALAKRIAPVGEVLFFDYGGTST
jgi:hypothetical protein